MSSVNKVILVGNLTRDPQKIETNSGTVITNLSIATNERRKSGDEYIDHTEYHDIVAFGRQAENAANYLSKGRKVFVEGRIQTRKYTDKNGVEQRKSEIVAQNIQFLSGRNESSESAGSSSGGYGGYSSNETPF